MANIDRKYKTAEKIWKQDGSGYIPIGEPCFLFRGQDVLAPTVLRFYAELLDQSLEYDNGMADEVRAQADAMEAWAPRKLPD